MARNRQRARDRKASRENPLHHENVSGELDHASGEVEEFDATLIQGADGEPTDVDEAELEAAAVEAAPPPPPAGRRPTEEDDDEDEGPRRRPTGPKPGGSRILNFLRASWAELQRVQWPDRRQVAQATAVVLGFVAIAGAYLGVADAAAQKIVDYIL